MKGVILGIAPDVKIVDLTHEIAPQQVREAALMLAASIDYFPAGTIHVAVVDPQVGTSRSVILARTSRSYLLAPDNGLLTLALRREPPSRMIRVTKARYFLPNVSSTFHGRDIFAPVAGYLASGVPMEEFGEEERHIMELIIPSPRKQGRKITGEIIYIDRFGNLITNIPVEALSVGCARLLKLGNSHTARFCDSYAAGSPGEAIALSGSFGLVEIAIFCNSAAEVLGSSVGDPVEVELEQERKSRV